MRLSIRMEKHRGFQPPWYHVQVVTCEKGHVTRWRSCGALGLRRTPSGRLVPVTELFPGRCGVCDAAYVASVNAKEA